MDTAVRRNGLLGFAGRVHGHGAGDLHRAYAAVAHVDVAYWRLGQLTPCDAVHRLHRRTAAQSLAAIFDQLLGRLPRILQRKEGQSAEVVEVAEAARDEDKAERVMRYRLVEVTDTDTTVVSLDFAP